MQSEPELSLPEIIEGLVIDIKLSELSELVVDQWKEEDVATFLLCVYSELMEKHPKAGQTIGMGLAEEFTLIALDSCTN